MLKHWIWVGVLAMGVFPCNLAAGEAKGVDVAARLQAFSKAWPSDRVDHRTAGNDSWKAYARTLRVLVAAGDVPALKKGLADENRQVRALCARALGYLGDEHSVEALAKALTKDGWPTVRLLAADSLGAFVTPAAQRALAAAKDVEKNRDVRLHIDIALRREKAPGKGPQEALLKLTEADLGAATVGKPAPAFRLEDSTGKTFSLAEERKHPVVLVFLYGDG